MTGIARAGVTEDASVPGDPDLPRCEHSVGLSGSSEGAAYCSLPVDHHRYGLDHKASILFDAADPDERVLGHFNVIVTWAITERRTPTASPGADDE